MMISRKSKARISLAVMAAAALAAISASPRSAKAAAITTTWTFESLSFPSGTGTATSYAAPTHASVSGGAPASGDLTATLSVLHATTSTISTPSGNGSSKSFSSNGWSVGDDYEFDLTSSAGNYSTLAFDIIGSSTGPSTFEVYANTGSGFTDLGESISVPVPTVTSSATSVTNSAHTVTASWGTATSASLTASTVTIDVSSLVGLTGIQLVDLNTTSLSGGTVGSGGTDRLDNVTFTAAAPLVPEPASLATLGAGATFLLGRRRRR